MSNGLCATLTRLLRSGPPVGVAYGPHFHGNDKTGVVLSSWDLVGHLLSLFWGYVELNRKKTVAVSPKIGYNTTRTADG